MRVISSELPAHRSLHRSSYHQSQPKTFLPLTILNQPSFLPQQFQQHQQQQQQLALLQQIMRIFYFFHLIIISLIFTYLLFRFKEYFIQEKFALIVLIVYCYMIVWNWLVNFVLVVCERQTVAVVFNRMWIRFMIMCYLPFGLLILNINQNIMKIKQILLLNVYLCSISVIFIIYQIYGCTIGETQNPKYIFQHNDLQIEKKKVWEIRRQYNKEMLRMIRNNQIEEKLPENFLI